MLASGCESDHPGLAAAPACAATIRIGLLKIGAAVLRNTRRVRELLAPADPKKHVLFIAARALSP